MRRNRNICCGVDQAFTLIELLVVMAILGILMSLIVTLAGSIRAEGHLRRTETDLKVLYTQIVSYRDATGRYPETDPNTSVTLVTALQWNNTALGTVRSSMAVHNATVLLLLLDKVDKTHTEVRERFSPDRFMLTTDPNLPGRFYIGDDFDFHRPINYLRDGGPGGSPLLFSAGQDANWMTADVIRSDEQGP
jgi:prepilin-type N-terminal cleavage/methylation domain-containing protein